jgi:hypothetical protein
VAAFFVPGLPESFGRQLDDLSPSAGESDENDPTIPGKDGDG